MKKVIAALALVLSFTLPSFAKNHKAKPVPPTPVVQPAGASVPVIEFANRTPDSNTVNFCSTDGGCQKVDITPASPEEATRNALLDFVWDTMTDQEKTDLANAQDAVMRAENNLHDLQYKIINAHRPTAPVATKGYVDGK